MKSLFSEVQSILNIVKNVDFPGFFKVDISKSEFILLKLIDEIKKVKHKDSVEVSEIVEKMEISAQAISKCLKNLENKGYIDRYSNRQDRRRMEVVMTKKGDDALNVVLKIIDDTMNMVFEGFSGDELAEYVRLTRKFKDLYISALQNME